MTNRNPLVEVMPRDGKGTGATSDVGNTRPIEWNDALSRITTGGWFWLATVRPNGAPHVMPLFAVWSDSVFFICSKDSTRKSRNLVADGRCVITSDRDDLHLIVEGHARRVADEATLHRASAAFETTYGWPTTVAGDKLDAEYGAPTSGGPPYGVFEVMPTRAFGLPSGGDAFAPTRWQFDS